MSKRLRNEHERRENDFYPTPIKSVRPLIPYLRAAGVKAFAEPCAGAGDLIRHVESFGLRCVYRGDIATGQDALDVSDFGSGVVTNPPYEKKLLLALIDHFMRAAPFAWLLLKADFAHVAYARPVLRHCTNIVPAGREAHLGEGSGMENCAWYRFELGHDAGPVIGPPGGRHAVLCARCGGAFVPPRTDARFCSPACRQRAYRQRLAVTYP